MASSASSIGDALVAAGHDNMQVANCLIMCRPRTFEEAVAWIQANPDKASGHIAGQVVPSFWTAGKDFNMGNPSEQFEVGEVVVLNRSDGTIKFGLVQKLNEPQAGIHVVLVDCGVETNSVKTLQISDIGKLVVPDMSMSQDINC